MRFEGKLKSWNEAKGFGFLAPNQGGQDIFVHISALPKGMGIPKVGQAFTFEIELNAGGKKRATRVQHPGALAGRLAPSSVSVRPKRTIAWRMSSVLLICALAAWLYGQFKDRLPGSALPFTEPSAVERGGDTAPNDVARTFRCDGRTHCSQMTSCGEARFFLANCPNVEMDGDGDSVPCEKQWCSF